MGKTVFGMPGVNEKELAAAAKKKSAEQKSVTPAAANAKPESTGAPMVKMATPQPAKKSSEPPATAAQAAPAAKGGAKTVFGMPAIKLPSAEELAAKGSQSGTSTPQPTATTDAAPAASVEGEKESAYMATMLGTAPTAKTLGQSQVQLQATAPVADGTETDDDLGTDGVAGGNPPMSRGVVIGLIICGVVVLSAIAFAAAKLLQG